MTGDNFSGGEEVTIRFDVPVVGSALADSSGHFVTTIKIPGDYDAFGDGQHSITAVGKTSVKNASRPFQLNVG